jgi:hypothetical protein
MKQVGMEAKMKMRQRIKQASICGLSSGLSYLSRLRPDGVLIPLISFWLVTIAAHAQDATWSTTAGSADWNTAANWVPSAPVPPAVPTGTASFGASATTAVTLSANASIGELQFNGGAPAYSFNPVVSTLTITGVGIVNNSSFSPTFTNAGNGETSFTNASVAANSIIINNSGGFTSFSNTSTAGTATITNNQGGNTEFLDTASAGSATIIENGGGTPATTGVTIFLDSSHAGTAIITTNSGGETVFENTSSGDQATFITNGTVDISQLTSAGTSAGSISGAGFYDLGSKQLTVGSNNLAPKSAESSPTAGLSPPPVAL